VWSKTRTICSCCARIDLRFNAAGDPVFLEANANPDLSPRYFGIMASWMGLTYEDVLARILRAGLARRVHNGHNGERL
jgi:D-alanine-D-alanine ligase-like ATP-grasp enzyme